MVGSKWVTGQLVISTAGRDINRYFLIYEVLDQSFVRVIDGDLHRVENPKRKNTKHLRSFQMIDQALVAKLEQNLRPNNAEVRKAIEGLRAKLES